MFTSLSFPPDSSSHYQGLLVQSLHSSYVSDFFQPYAVAVLHKPIPFPNSQLISNDSEHMASVI